MLCNYKNYERIGHLKPFKILGADKSIKEPRRLALSMLFECYDYKTIRTFNLPLLSTFTDQEIQLLHKAWENGLNSPLTSSIGRLFDIVASLTNTLHVSDYEGQSGLLLEAQCHDENALIFSYEINEGVINLEPMVKEIVNLVLTSDTSTVADRFINTLVDIMAYYAQKYSEFPIIFSGGVFQNKVLLSRAIKHFKSKERKYYMQERTPINDGGISLGQIAFAIKN